MALNLEEALDYIKVIEEVNENLGKLREETLKNLHNENIELVKQNKHLMRLLTKNVADLARLPRSPI